MAMKIYNLRIERKEGMSYLICNMEAKFTDVKTVWYSVHQEYEDWLNTDVYDSFLIAALYPAMFYKEDIIIEGNVSERLLFNVKNYVQDIIRAFHPEFRKANVKVQGFSNPQQIAKNVGTGFSAGVDSFSTIYDHLERETDENYKISSLFFFNVGSHGGGGEIARQRFLKRFNYLKSFPESKGLPYIGVDSNLFDFYLKPWEYQAGAFLRASAILLFQRKVSKYFASGSNSYWELMYFPFSKRTEYMEVTFYDVYVNTLLSTECTEIIDDGNQYSRTQKTELIADYPPAHQYLNVCVDHADDYLSAQNCSICSKCLRTLITLESLNKLEAFSKVFDIEKYKKISYKYKCECRLLYDTDEYAKDNVDFAIAHGNPIPSYAEARLYLLPSHAKHFAGRVLRKMAKITHLR